MHKPGVARHGSRLGPMTTLARQPLTYATNLAMALRIRPNITAAYERSYLSTECTEVVIVSHQRFQFFSSKTEG
ncbi:hypothetical protein VTN49DRAFT_995 [Thermomyces lanuginosus]|uniref:uncharacterized protein n=1 Tax=Thermomyces lanuginosus TaxID=5541 RepID=UPI003744126D